MRFRVPDTSPPYLCIEILSPDDPAVEVRAKIEGYLAMGVAYVWIVDPLKRRGEIHTREGIERVNDGRFRAGSLEADLAY